MVILLQPLPLSCIQSPLRARRRGHGWLYWLVLIVVGLLAIGGVRDAYAHAAVTRSEPTDMAVYPTAPAEIQLWFSEPVAQRFSSARLFDSQGQAVALDLNASAITLDNQLSFATPTLASGTYSLLWRALSEADGHFSQGMIVFGVGDAVDLSLAPPPTQAVTIAWPEILLRWLNLALVSAVVGAIAVIIQVLRPVYSAASTNDAVPGWNALIARLYQWLYWCIGLAVLIGVGLLVWQGLTLRMGTVAADALPSTTWLVLSQTRWGKLWLARQIILLLLWVIAWQQSQPANQQLAFVASRWWLLAVTSLLSVALLAVQALSGHAAGAQEQLLLTTVMAILHGAAASLWLGGLAALAFSLWPYGLSTQTHANTVAQACWRAFSLPALGSVLLLAATGLYNLAQQVASVDALLTTFYGRILLIKLALVVIMSVIGLRNALQTYPALLQATSRRLQHLADWFAPLRDGSPRFITPEIAVGMGVFLATALITATPPSRGVEFTLAPDAIPMALSQTVDDLVVTLAVTPNRPGQNVFTVRSVSSRRPAPAPILRVLLRFTPLDQALDPVTAIATEVDAGHYLVTGAYTKLAGAWQIDVVTRRLGLEDTVAHFTWTVAPPGVLRTTILSKQPWSGVLTLASAGMMILGLLVVMVIQQRRSHEEEGKVG